ncbi:MAG: thioredoxin [Clostridiales bacterium]|nr:thioredoxin [Clostridiales bacterium]
MERSTGKSTSDGKKDMTRVMAFVFLVLAVSLILIGIYKEQMQSVLAKAVRICMECVGIG